jgi:hypothetical protein
MLCSIRTVLTSEFGEMPLKIQMNPKMTQIVEQSYLLISMMLLFVMIEGLD